MEILCRIDGYYKNGVLGFVNFSELTKTGAKAILYLVKSSLNQIERIADDGIRTQHYDDARDAHVDAHVHDASRLCLRPVSFLIQFDCFQNFSTGKPKQASRFYLCRKEVLK